MTTPPVMSITDEQLAEIEAAANAATPGPWAHTDSAEYDNERWVMTADQQWSICAVHSGAEGADCEHENAAYICSANPATILALITRLREAEDDARRLEWMMREQCIVESQNGCMSPIVYRLYWGQLGECQAEWYPTEREAIDAAMESTP